MRKSLTFRCLPLYFTFSARSSFACISSVASVAVSATVRKAVSSAYVAAIMDAVNALSIKRKRALAWGTPVRIRLWFHRKLETLEEGLQKLEVWLGQISLKFEQKPGMPDPIEGFLDI